MVKKVFLSGVQPSGRPHIGNYFGAMKQFVELQEEYTGYILIVDYHALHSLRDPKAMRENIIGVLLDFLAIGLNPEKVTIFKQSDISEHTELTWIFDTITTMPYLMRAHAFKDAEAKDKEIDVGTFNYPVLMATDILLYDTDMVPVGADQKQHVEICRDIAEKFNNIYGETFKLPKPVIPKSGARIMDLIEPTKKMSKSDDREGRTLPLLASTDQLRSAIMGATTDSQKEIRFDASRPGIYNLLEIYEGVTRTSREEIESKFSGKGYGDFKKDLAEEVIAFLAPFQKRYQELIDNPSHLEDLLKEGKVRAEELANKKLAEVKSKVGLG